MSAADFPNPPAPQAPCVCGRTDGSGRAARPRAFGQCCGPWLAALGTEGAGAPDPESLMRSRYTAFVLGRVDYLEATWAAETCPRPLTLEPGCRWLGLEVRAAPPPAGDRGEVEFVARYRLGGRAVRLHEHSRFERRAGRWVYTEGDDLTAR